MSNDDLKLNLSGWQFVVLFALCLASCTTCYVVKHQSHEARGPQDGAP
jgi:hypothetical protein